MATTLSNMGLVQWNLSTDKFDHLELGANWTAVDNHDHTPGKGVQVPVNGIANGAITNSKLGTGAVDTSKVQDSNITDVKLASPNNAAYRLLVRETFGFFSTAAVGTFLAGRDGTLVTSGSDTTHAVSVYNLLSADYLVANKTTKLRLNFQVQTNTVASTTTLNAGLYPVSSMAGGASQLRYNVGAAVGNQVTIATPAASSLVNGVSAEFNWPGDGNYVLGIQKTGAMAANSALSATISIFYHNT